MHYLGCCFCFLRTEYLATASIPNVIRAGGTKHKPEVIHISLIALGNSEKAFPLAAGPMMANSITMPESTPSNVMANVA